MSYQTVEAGVLAVVQKIDGYDDENASRGDTRVLGSGNPVCLVINRGGPHEREELTLGNPKQVIDHWFVNLDLFVQEAGDRASVKNLVDEEVDKLVAELGKWPNLDATSGVGISQVRSVQEPEPWLIGSARWWLQTIELAVDEYVEVTLSE